MPSKIVPQEVRERAAVSLVRLSMMQSPCSCMHAGALCALLPGSERRRTQSLQGHHCSRCPHVPHKSPKSRSMEKRHTGSLQEAEKKP